MTYRLRLIYSFRNKRNIIVFFEMTNLPYILSKNLLLLDLGEDDIIDYDKFKPKLINMLKDERYV